MYRMLLYLRENCEGMARAGRGVWGEAPHKKTRKKDKHEAWAAAYNAYLADVVSDEIQDLTVRR